MSKGQDKHQTYICKDFYRTALFFACLVEIKGKLEHTGKE